MNKTLYKKDSKGKIRVWIITVALNMIYTEHGIHGMKKVKKQECIKGGKNIGKSNETSPEEQAILEATSTWQHKKDKGYFETIEEANNEIVYLPMLAHKFTQRKHNIKYPAFVQPKLDGVRCLAKKINNNEIHFMSRGGKNYDVLKLCSMKSELLKLMNVGEIFDGEIYKHGWSLQKITSAVKKFRVESLELEYWVYDNINDNSFKERTKKIPVSVGSIKKVETKQILSEKDVYDFHYKYVQEGFEGVIIRNTNGLYKLGSRSSDLQKYKEFIDAEFEVVGFKAEENNINGIDYKCIVYICKTTDGAEFNCRPRGSLQSRHELYKVGVTCIGKELTVRYQTLTDDLQGNGKKVPQFPVGICIRDYE